MTVAVVEVVARQSDKKILITVIQTNYLVLGSGGGFKVGDIVGRDSSTLLSPLHHQQRAHSSTPIRLTRKMYRTIIEFKKRRGYQFDFFIISSSYVR